MGTPSTAAEVRESPGLGQVLRDTRFVFWREMLLPLRDPFSLIFSLIQPLVFLGLFGPLLGAAVGAPAFGGQSTLQRFLPGVVVVIALFGTSHDRQDGSCSRGSIGTDTFLGLLAASVTAAVGLVVGLGAISRDIR
jgi:hypothetical protein